MSGAQRVDTPASCWTTRCKRQLVTAKATPAFKAYQKVLAARIKAIEERSGKPEKGDDILLSVITDGRHAAIDMRLVAGNDNEPENKLNALIANAHRIWLGTGDRAYRKPDGSLYPHNGGAQMIVSDLGTEAADEKRGFSAYVWIRDELIRLGVPRDQIAFMQHYKKAAAKQGLFNDVNSGRVRFLLGSTQTIRTGVNAQQRLVALHHLDVPWLPSDIEQRERRIERQGNQNEEIDLYAFATLGSVDATSWQLLERKARFISAALAGDRSIRRLQDVPEQADQFAKAKALASGDARLMQKAGIEAEVARLRRLRAAHQDDQFAIARHIHVAEDTIRSAGIRIAQIEEDLKIRTPTRGEAFSMVVGDRTYADRKPAGAALLSRIRIAEKEKQAGQATLGAIGGFELKMQVERLLREKSAVYVSVWLDRTGHEPVEIDDELTPLGLVSRLEWMFDRLEADLAEHRRWLTEAEQRLPAYRSRRGEMFIFEVELRDKEGALQSLEAALAANERLECEEDTPAIQADAA